MKIVLVGLLYVILYCKSVPVHSGLPEAPSLFIEFIHGTFSGHNILSDKAPNFGLWRLREVKPCLSLVAVWCIRFSQEPADQSVVLGERVVLSCVVFNYSGIVQWTKDGLALGVGEGLRGEYEGNWKGGVLWGEKEGKKWYLCLTSLQASM